MVALLTTLKIMFSDVKMQCINNKGGQTSRNEYFRGVTHPFEILAHTLDQIPLCSIFLSYRWWSRFLYEIGSLMIEGGTRIYV